MQNNVLSELPEELFIYMVQYMDLQSFSLFISASSTTHAVIYYPMTWQTLYENALQQELNATLKTRDGREGTFKHKKIIRRLSLNQQVVRNEKAAARVSMELYNHVAQKKMLGYSSWVKALLAQRSTTEGILEVVHTVEEKINLYGRDPRKRAQYESQFFQILIPNVLKKRYRGALYNEELVRKLFVQYKCPFGYEWLLEVAVNQSLRDIVLKLLPSIPIDNSNIVSVISGKEYKEINKLVVLIAHGFISKDEVITQLVAFATRFLGESSVEFLIRVERACGVKIPVEALTRAIEFVCSFYPSSKEALAWILDRPDCDHSKKATIVRDVLQNLANSTLAPQGEFLMDNKRQLLQSITTRKDFLEIWNDARNEQLVTAIQEAKWMFVYFKNLKLLK
jgi:hypothetical protein